MNKKQLASARRKIQKVYNLAFKISDAEAVAEIESLKRKAAKGTLDDLDERLYTRLQVGDGAIEL